MKREAGINIKKSISHLRKIAQMLEEDAYCIDIIQQIQAVQGYLKSAQKKILEGHLRSCYKSAVESKDPKEEERVIKELVKILSTT